MGAPDRLRCFACGRFADEQAHAGPPADEVGQATRWAAGVLDVHGDGSCRAAVACWPCFWRTDPDQWIPAARWEALGPLVPFARLPLLLSPESPARWTPAGYPWPE